MARGELVRGLPKSSTGAGFYIDYFTPGRLFGVRKIAPAWIVDRPDYRKFLKAFLARWRQSVGKGYRVSDVYYSTGTPWHKPRRPHSIKAHRAWLDKKSDAPRLRKKMSRPRTWQEGRARRRARRKRRTSR